MKQNRKQRRAHLNLPRKFNNKKGVQMVVVKTGKYQFTKYRKHLQQIGNKQILHTIEA